MPQSPEVVIFDLGKVLVDFDYSICARKLSAKGKSLTEEVQKMIDHSPLLFRYETGQIDKAEPRRAIGRGAACDEARFSVDKVHDCPREWRAIVRHRDAAEVAEDRLRLPRHRRDRRRIGEHGRRDRVVLRRLRESADELISTCRAAARSGVGQGVGRAV